MVGGQSITTITMTMTISIDDDNEHDDEWQWRLRWLRRWYQLWWCDVVARHPSACSLRYPLGRPWLSWLWISGARGVKVPWRGNCKLKSFYLIFVSMSDSLQNLNFGAVAYWWYRSACNAESTGSNLVLCSYCVGTLSKSFALECSRLSMSWCMVFSEHFRT